VRCSASSGGSETTSPVAAASGAWNRACTPRLWIVRCYTQRTANMFLKGQIVGKYRILAPLGSGGFGSVFLAEETTWIHKKFAIKVPHKQNLDFTDMLKEPRLLASLNHPNIVTAVTAEKQDGVFFIVMEYVTGETLERIILRDGALDLPRALDFTCQMCNAVDHAHRVGVLHRDLRPGNMLVSDSGQLKVTDFGTSRFLEIAAHGTTVIGSPPYMAPEQFYGKAVFASDVYSVGVTMYQMLTGDLPYATPAPSDIERLMRGELVTPPRLRNNKIPKAINDIVMKALAADVTHRYQRASDLLTDVLGGDDGVAPAGVGGGAARSQCRRDPVAPPRARNAAVQLLLALPEAVAGAHDEVPVLRRNPEVGADDPLSHRHSRFSRPRRIRSSGNKGADDGFSWDRQDLDERDARGLE